MILTEIPLPMQGWILAQPARASFPEQTELSIRTRMDFMNSAPEMGLSQSQLPKAMVPVWEVLV